MIFAAIDPGAVHAAIAVFHDSNPVFVDDLRTAGGMLDATAFAHALRTCGSNVSWSRTSTPCPPQGVSSTFRFGMGFGIIHGVAGALRLLYPGDPGDMEGLPQPSHRAQGSRPRPGDQKMAGAQPASRH